MNEIFNTDGLSTGQKIKFYLVVSGVFTCLCMAISVFLIEGFGDFVLWFVY